jgi:hypothetical protein
VCRTFDRVGRHGAAAEGLTMLEQGSPARHEASSSARPVSCDECTIQIGEGFQESVAFEFVDESGPRPRRLVVCWRCWESLNRRRKKGTVGDPRIGNL